MIARLPVILVALYLLTACSGPGYYMQAISGQWKLMRSREEIQALLDNPETSPELAAQLQSASRIKVFAEAVLDLPGDGSYSSYVEVGGSALVWNVIATPEFSLQAKQWCFPVAGCVPYRGYFDQHKANDSADRLRRKGMDVHVSPAAAYLTPNRHSASSFSGTSSSHSGFLKLRLMPRASLPICMPSTMR